MNHGVCVSGDSRLEERRNVNHCVINRILQTNNTGSDDFGFTDQFWFHGGAAWFHGGAASSFA